MLRPLLVAGALALTTAAHAGETITCNQHGAVVTLTDGTTLYMGKSCDVARKGGGTGAWWNAASALVVEIDGKAFRVAEGRGIDCLPYCAPR